MRIKYERACVFVKKKTWHVRVRKYITAKERERGPIARDKHSTRIVRTAV